MKLYFLMIFLITVFLHINWPLQLIRNLSFLSLKKGESVRSDTLRMLFLIE